jgi:hypothetical protein
MSESYTPRTGECPMSHGAIEAYGLTDKQVSNWCDKGCCPECGRMLAEKLRK